MKPILLAIALTTSSTVSPEPFPGFAVPDNVVPFCQKQRLSYRECQLFAKGAEIAAYADRLKQRLDSCEHTLDTLLTAQAAPPAESDNLSFSLLDGSNLLMAGAGILAGVLGAWLTVRAL